MKPTFTLLIALLFTGLAVHAGEPLTLPLWPEGVPEKPDFKSVPQQDVRKDDGYRRINHVSNPTITVYRATPPNGTAVLVCPGGGYNGLAIEHEGTLVAEYLNTLGVTSILLTYRVPRRDPEQPHEAPLADARRAMSMIRKHAAEWGIKPDRVGILGFSAGGHLCVMTALHSSGDERPDFMVPVYPAYLTKERDDYTLRPEIVVTKDAPPACFIHAGDDKITAAGSALVYLEYKKLGIPAEIHIYAIGGHGFGMKPNGKPVNDWPIRVNEWMRASGWLP